MSRDCKSMARKEKIDACQLGKCVTQGDMTMS